MKAAKHELVHGPPIRQLVLRRDIGRHRDSRPLRFRHASRALDRRGASPAPSIAGSETASPGARLLCAIGIVRHGRGVSRWSRPWLSGSLRRDDCNVYLDRSQRHRHGPDQQCHAYLESRIATSELAGFSRACGALSHCRCLGGRGGVCVVFSCGGTFTDGSVSSGWNAFVAYGQSKTANILFAVELTRRWAANGIFSNALNPGAIATNLQKHTGGLKTPRELRKTPQEGAAISVLLAASPLLAGIGGRYLEDCNEARVVMSRPTEFSGGVAPYALDPGNATRLWTLAERLTAE